MNIETLIKDYWWKYPDQGEGHRYSILSPSYVVADKKKLKIHHTTGVRKRQAWFRDMKLLVARLRLLGVDVTWPKDRVTKRQKRKPHAQV